MSQEEARFWRYVRQVGACWVWVGAIRDGYGRFRAKSGMVSSHRFAFERVRGKIPTKRVLDHVCRRRSCVHPFHHDPVTQRVNVARGESPVAPRIARLLASGA